MAGLLSSDTVPPTTEAAVLGLVGRVIAPLGNGEGVQRPAAGSRVSAHGGTSV